MQTTEDIFYKDKYYSLINEAQDKYQNNAWGLGVLVCFIETLSYCIALAGLELLLLLLCQRRVLSFLGWPGALSPTGSIGTPKIPKLALVGVF